MKKNLFLLLVAILAFASCKPEGGELVIDQETNVSALSIQIPPSQLPAPILNYISTNYPNSTITEAEQYDTGGNTTYEVELNTGEELLFAPNGNLLAMGSGNSNGSNDNDGISISIGDLPTSIVEYINTNYPSATILFAEQEYSGEFEVYLSNGIELHFDSNGVFLSMGGDNDDDGEDDDDNGGTGGTSGTSTGGTSGTTTGGTSGTTTGGTSGTTTGGTSGTTTGGTSTSGTSTGGTSSSGTTDDDD